MLQSPFHIERDVQDERFTAASLREPTTHFRSAWMRAWEIITSQTILPFHAFEFLKCWGEILRPMLRRRPALDPCSNLTYSSSPRSQRVTFTTCSRRIPSVKKPCLATILVTIVKSLRDCSGTIPHFSPRLASRHPLEKQRTHVIKRL